MAEIRRGVGNEGLSGQRLPWLEPVEDEDDVMPGRSGGWLKWALVLIGIVAVAVIAATMLGRWHAQRSDIGTLIKADPTPYKVKPADPGGLKVDSNDRISQRTGVGSDINSPLDLAAIPEQPIVGAGAPAGGPAPAPAPTPAQTASRPPAPKPAPPVAQTASAAAPKVLPPAPKPEPKPAPALAAAAPTPSVSGNGNTVQLGAFSTEAKAKAAWKALSKRFGYLAPLTPVILPVKSDDATLYRLRATGGPAASICARMKVAGEACAVAG